MADADDEMVEDIVPQDEVPPPPSLPHQAMVWLWVNHSGWMTVHQLWANAHGMDLMVYLQWYWPVVVDHAMQASTQQ